MLVLGTRRVWVHWKEAGVDLLLSPLADDVDQRLVDETTEHVIGENGELKDVQRDIEAYAQGIARECVHDWQGVVDEHGETVAFSEPARDEFMRIQPARAFVTRKVRGLDLYRQQEVEAAKKG